MQTDIGYHLLSSTTGATKGRFVSRFPTPPSQERWRWDRGLSRGQGWDRNRVIVGWGGNGAADLGAVAEASATTMAGTMTMTVPLGKVTRTDTIEEEGVGIEATTTSTSEVRTQGFEEEVKVQSWSLRLRIIFPCHCRHCRRPPNLLQV